MHAMRLRLNDTRLKGDTPFESQAGLPAMFAASTQDDPLSHANRKREKLKKTERFCIDAGKKRFLICKSGNQLVRT